MQVKNISAEDRDIASKAYEGIVAAGETADVPDEVGESLIQQADVWKRVATSKADKADDKT